MGNEWIIDVIADLQSFANIHGLPFLAAQLEEASRVAVTEIKPLVDHSTPVFLGDGSGLSEVFDGVGSSRHI